MKAGLRAALTALSLNNEPIPLYAGRPRCPEPNCPRPVDDRHYHCARCSGITGMYGHYRGVEWLNGKARAIDGHMCCPDNCEQPDAHTTGRHAR